jgi:hypothetical protein
MLGHYILNLSQAIEDILNLSDEWDIDVWEDTSSTERRISMNSNLAVTIVLTSFFASPDDVAMINRKLNGQDFIDQLKSRGFKASKASLPLTTSISTGDIGPSSLVIGVCSAAGILTGLVLLFCMKKCFFPSSMDRSRMDKLFGTVLSKIYINSSIDESFKLSGNEMVDETIATVSGGGASDCNNMVTELATHPFLVERHCMDQINTADYSKALEDILQLFAGLNISIKSFVDPSLRKEIQASIQHSSKITPHDRAAVLQIISKFEFDANLLVHTTDQSPQQQTDEGPLTELHFLALKLICESEIHDRTAVNDDTVPDVVEVANKKTDIIATQGDLDIVEGRVACDKSLLDVLLLLKKCDLEPSYLLQKESRKLIEENLTHQQGPLLTEHLAVLQLLSKAEIDSDLSMDSERKHLLEQRIKEGPLDANHLWAAQSLSKLERGESSLCELAKMDLSGQLGTRIQPEENISQLGAADLASQAESEQHELCIVAHPVSDLVSVVESGVGTAAMESQAPFFIDMIGGLEVRSSLLTRAEKSALQQMELRAKTAKIRQSLPEWVRNGLAPPRPGPVSLVPPPAVMEKKVIEGAESHPSSMEAVLISCDVRADIGFLSDFMLPAASSVQHEILESLFFGEEGNMGIVIGDTQQSAGRQAALFDEQGPELLPTPQSGVRAVLAWLSSVFAQSLTCCVRAVLGTCCSLESYQPCYGQRSLPSQGD